MMSICMIRQPKFKCESENSCKQNFSFLKFTRSKISPGCQYIIAQKTGSKVILTDLQDKYMRIVEEICKKKNKMLNLTKSKKSSQLLLQQLCNQQVKCDLFLIDQSNKTLHVLFFVFFISRVYFGKFVKINHEISFVNSLLQFSKSNNNKTNKMRAFVTEYQSKFKDFRQCPFRPVKKINISLWIELLNMSAKTVESQYRGLDIQKIPTQLLDTKISNIHDLRCESLQEINTLNTYPYSATGQVKMIFRQNGKCFVRYGTGSLIGPRTVLTSAENCHLQACEEKQLVSLEFLPTPLLRYTQKGFKVINKYIPDKFSQYLSSESQNKAYSAIYDFAVLQLQNSLNLQRQFGSFGFDFEWNQNKKGMKFVQDKKEINEIRLLCHKDQTKTLYQAKVTMLLDNYFSIYALPENAYLKGGPIVVSEKKGYIIVGLHQRDLQKILPGNSVGLQLDKYMFEDIQKSYSKPKYVYKQCSGDLVDERIEGLVSKLSKQKQTLKADPEVYYQLLLYKNRIRDEGCRHFQSLNKLENLSYLQLINNKITSKGCKFLSEIAWNSLKKLALAQNKITSIGIRHLMKANWIKTVQILNLNENLISNEGCRYLAKADLQCLTTLELGLNNISDEGVEALLKMELYTIEKISLFNNKIQSNRSVPILQHQWPNLQKIQFKNIGLGQLMSRELIYLRNQRMM